MTWSEVEETARWECGYYRSELRPGRSGNENLIRQILPDLAGIVLLYGCLALGLELVHRRKDSDFHKQQNKKTRRKIRRRVPVLAQPFKKSGSWQGSFEFSGLGSLAKAVFEHADSLSVGAHQQIGPVRLGLHGR